MIFSNKGSIALRLLTLSSVHSSSVTIEQLVNDGVPLQNVHVGLLFPEDSKAAAVGRFGGLGGLLGAATGCSLDEHQ